MELSLKVFTIHLTDVIASTSELQDIGSHFFGSDKPSLSFKSSISNNETSKSYVVVCALDLIETGG